MSWLLTHTGKHLDLIDPQPDMIDLIDIAHGLANECRYAGQCLHYYSVAQHSELASRIVPPEYAWEALLHDATEAYLKDIPRPLKLLLPDYRAVESRLDGVIRHRFGLLPNPSAQVKYADLVLLATERRDLMPADATPWPVLHGVMPQDKRIRAMHAGRAKLVFLQRSIEILQCTSSAESRGDKGPL